MQGEWYSSCLFDQVHPDDVEKVREQLSTQEPQNTGRILDLKTGTVKKEGHQCKFIHLKNIIKANILLTNCNELLKIKNDVSCM